MFNIDPQKFLKSAFKQQSGLKGNNTTDTRKGIPDSKPLDNSSNNSKLNKDALNKDLNTKIEPKPSAKSDGTQKQLELGKDGKTASTKSYKDAQQEKVMKMMKERGTKAASAKPSPSRDNANLEDPGSPNSPKPNVVQNKPIDTSKPEPSVPSTQGVPKDSMPDISGNIPKSKFKRPSMPRMKVPKFKR